MIDKSQFNEAVENFIIEKVIVDTIKEAEKMKTNTLTVKYSDLIKAIVHYVNELEMRLYIYCKPMGVLNALEWLNEYFMMKRLINNVRVKENTCKEFAEMINKRTDAIRVECIKRGRIFKTTYIAFHVLKHETDIDIRKSLLELLRKTRPQYYKCVQERLERNKDGFHT